MDRRIGQSAARGAGFTLIELLLVLVILAVLAAVIVPKFTGRSEQARITAARTDIAGIETALNTFEIDNGRYPTTDEGLEALYEEPANLSGRDPASGWRGPYIKRGVPRDPWGNAYIYESPGRYNLEGYDLYSAGPDGQSGTEDDITNWSEER